MPAGRAEPPPGRALVPGQHHHHPYITIIRYLARVRGESGLVPAAFIEIIARCSLDLFYLLGSLVFVKGQSSGFFHKPYSNPHPALITELCPTCPALSDLALLKRWNVPEKTLTVSLVDNASSGLSNQETPRRRNSLCDRRRLCLQRCTT